MSSTEYEESSNEIDINEKLKEKNDSFMIEDTHKTIERYLKSAGGFNRYQKYMLFFFVLILIEISMLMLSATFIYLPPTFLCQSNPDNPHNETCGENDGGCDKQILDPDQKNTYSIQFDLYCNNSNIRDLACSMLFVGSIFGNILLGIAGDIYGRKIVLQISWFISSMCTIGIAFTYNQFVLITMNFIVGFFSWPVLNLLLLLLNEETSEQYRQMASLMLMIAWAIGEILLSPIAYFVQDFRNIIIFFIMIPCLTLNIPLIFVIESPNYYISRNNIDKALLSLKKISKFNKKELIISKRFLGDDFQNEKKPEDNLLFNFLALFKYKSLRKITIASCTVMITIQVFYFGCQFALSGIGYDLYLNQLVAGTGELVTLIISNFVIPKFLRKRSIIIATFLSILICLSYSIVKNNETQTAFIGLLRVSNIFQLGIFQVYIPELYPTQVRSVGAGIIFGLGNFGSVVAPYVVSKADSIGIGQMVFVGVIGVLGLIASIFLRETFNKPLQDQIEELKAKQQSEEPLSSAESEQ
ncbi:hypothetical protein ABPG74_001182 [Tetrahymena malaccensis]